MGLSVSKEEAVVFVEGRPESASLRTPQDAGLLVEDCINAGVNAALLYPPNMTAKFFDLKSGEAGEILQKLRNYGIRLALVCPPGSVRVTLPFLEMAEAEGQGTHFRVFESREAAVEWLRTD